MNIIKQNPFRILGLAGNSSEKELQKQISLIKRYAEIGKTKSFEYDFEFIGDFIRNLDGIQHASNSIGQAHKRLLYSLFWFVKNNKVDEIAFNSLKEKDTDKASDIWNKTLKDSISSKNYSSYLNLSTLYIALSTVNNQIELQKLQVGISLKGNLIHSENLKDFSILVTGDSIANDPIEISKKFVNEIIILLKPFMNKKRGISTNEIISLFSSFPLIIQKYISSKFTEIPISSIEKNIEETIIKRKEKPRDAEIHGENLYKSTKKDIVLLKKILGTNNVQFKMIANKIANEILECSIVFYNKLIVEEDGFDPIEDALRIGNLANTVGATGQVKQRINDTLKTFEEIKYSDCLKSIETLKYIQSVYEEVKEDNKQKQRDQHQYIDSIKILEILKINLNKKIIEKIANSAKNDLIFEFNDILSKIIKTTSVSGLYDLIINYNQEYLHNSVISAKLTSYYNIFIELLPSNNKIKIEFEKEKERTIITKEIRKIKSIIKGIENELSINNSKVFYDSQLQTLNHNMKAIKGWTMFRSKETKELQINHLQHRIDELIKKGSEAKKNKIDQIKKQLVSKKAKLNILNEKYSKI